MRGRGSRGPWRLVVLALAGSLACGNDTPAGRDEAARAPRCAKASHDRSDAHTPASVVSDWSQPVRLGAPINTPCPEDAIEISRDGTALFFLFTADTLASLPPAQIFAPAHGTYRAARTGGPGTFAEPTFFDLGKGVDQSLDGELSFSPDGRRVFFHSLRSSNTGYRSSPPRDDFLDIYVAEITGGEPGPGVNLGAPVNSDYPDGEHALHPDGVSLYLTSPRPGGLGNNDIWLSTSSAGAWTMPLNLGEPVNSPANELQPAFTGDGATMYFTSDRDPSVGTAIYRSRQTGGLWSEPELVIKGIVGEPSVTGDGRYLYFVHVLTDAAGAFDADVWFAERTP